MQHCGGEKVVLHTGHPPGRDHHDGGSRIVSPAARDGLTLRGRHEKIGDEQMGLALAHQTKRLPAFVAVSTSYPAPLRALLTKAQISGLSSTTTIRLPDPDLED